jgi:2-oxoisovalerate dehydrogenase E2 component (dihydrolipoyl transacylase)
MGLQTFRLPDPGEGLVEADIVTWRVAVGDQIKINDILVEVETSKSLVELPSPYAGTVTELLVNEGESVDVGSPIISIDDGVGDAQPAPSSGNGEEAQVPNLVGYGPRTGTAKRRPRRVSGEGPVEAHEQVADTFSVQTPVSRRADDREPLHADRDTPTGAPLPGPGKAAPAATPSGGAILAKPPVRKLAKDLGVDLATLVGSGPGGVITRDDVTGASMKPERSHRLSPSTSVVLSLSKGVVLSLSKDSARHPLEPDRPRARMYSFRSRASESRPQTPWCARRSQLRMFLSGRIAT